MYGRAIYKKHTVAGCIHGLYVDDVCSSPCDRVGTYRCKYSCLLLLPYMKRFTIRSSCLGLCFCDSCLIINLLLPLPLKYFSSRWRWRSQFLLYNIIIVRST